jgi:RimJ/RimL family protein N-acetyltransferase
MTPIWTERLILRNWEERDRDLFHRINSDDHVMEFFDFRRDRETADVVMDRMREEIARDGFGWTPAEIAATSECIGFIGLHRAEVPGVAPEGTYEIGWRLAPEFWGNGFASEGARALIGGVWIMASPFVLNYAGQLRTWHIVLGAAVALLAVLEIWQDRDRDLKA